jgi:hypothetical protein
LQKENRPLREDVAILKAATSFFVGQLCAKAPARRNEEAANKISFARFRSRTPRSSSFSLAASAVVVPGYCPVSTQCCLTQFHNVSGTTPIRGPIPSPPH